jgi:hypothetical protein
MTIEERLDKAMDDIYEIRLACYEILKELGEIKKEAKKDGLRSAKAGI